MIAANSASVWVPIFVTALLGVVTAYIAGSSRQKRRQEIAIKVAGHRFDAYGVLWSKIRFSPELSDLTGAPPLDETRRRDLFDQFTSWYYDDGNGMLLGGDTRSIYLKVKKNLICKPDCFVPSSLRHDVQSDAERSKRVIRQLSLLRSAMRADLEVYGKPWGKTLDDVDREFLYACRIPGWRVERTFAERRRWFVYKLKRRTRPRALP